MKSRGYIIQRERGAYRYDSIGFAGIGMLGGSRKGGAPDHDCII